MIAISRSSSSTLVHPGLIDATSDRLLDDCALDQNLGVLRRSCPRTYAWRVQSECPAKPVSILRRAASRVYSKVRGLLSNPWNIHPGVGHVAQHAALAAGFVAAMIATTVSILQQNEATAHVATGFISFATVSIMTLLFVVPSLHLLGRMGVDLDEIVGTEE